MVALGVAFGIAAAAAYASPELTRGLRADGVADPDAVIQVLGSLTVLAAAATLGIAGLRNHGRRRVGQLTVALGSVILGIATLAFVSNPSRSIGLVKLGDGLTPAQTVGFAVLVAGVIAMPSALSWSRVALIDAGLVATTVIALTWLAPLRPDGTSPVGPLDIVERHPTAALLLALMTVGALLLVRVAQSAAPGDLAIVVAAVIIPSAAYNSLVGELAGPLSTPIRTAMVWWLCGPAMLLLAGIQAVRAGPQGDDPVVAPVEDASRAARSEWVASAAILLSLGAVATHKLFIESLDPVMLAVGLVTVALSIGRLALLQQRQVALQRRLEALAVELHDRARTDELTGLGNRIALMEELDRCFDRGEQVHAFYADVDDFKGVNDALGHETGDRLLVVVARRLLDTVGPSTFRMGGDEFVSIRTDLDTAGATAISRSIVARSDESVSLGDVSMPVRLSVGVASSEQGATTGDELVRDADLALHRAKELGRSRAAVFDVWLQERADRRLAVLRGLRDAVDRDGFEVRYRPIVDLDDGTVLGAEAMVRWNGTDHHQLTPAEFFEVAADSGLVPAISRSMLRAVAAPWRRDRPPVPLEIPLSPQELVNGGLADDLDELLGNLSRPSFRIRIPESSLSDPAARATIRHIVEREHRICVSDFGTAASSLRHLSRLSDPQVCIDRSFVSGLGQRTADRIVLRSIVEVGDRLGFTVCADGVTRPGQATMLRSLGIRRAQGWLFGRPLDWPTFSRRLADHGSGLTWRPAAPPAQLEVNR